MNRDEAVAKLAEELAVRAKRAEETAAAALGDKGEVVMKPVNHTLDADEQLDEALIDLAFAHVMAKLNCPWMAETPKAAPPRAYNEPGAPPVPGEPPPPGAAWQR